MPVNPIVESRRQKILSFLETTGNCSPIEDIAAECFPAKSYREEWCPVVRSRVTKSFDSCTGYGRHVEAHTHAEIEYRQSDVSPASVYGYLRDLIARGQVEAVAMGRKNYYKSVNSARPAEEREAEIKMLEKMMELS